MKKIYSSLLLLCSFHFAGAQLVTGNAFIKGQFVEVGINACGGFGSTVAAPLDYHARSGMGPGTPSFNLRCLGFVADTDKDGWTAGAPNKYSGDYFLPAGPWVGWGISFNTYRYYTDRGYAAINNCTGNTFPGSITEVVNAATVAHATWQGTVNGLMARKTTTIKSDKLYFTVRVDLYNNSAATINNIFYGDYVNPDNDFFYQDVPLNNVSNQNSIVYQNPADGRALVKAVGPRQTYLGLGSKDCRSKVFRSRVHDVSDDVKFWYNSASHAFTGADAGLDNLPLGISFNIGSLAAGDSTSFTYTYILRESDFEEALAETETLVENNTVQYNNGDTLYACSGSSIPLALINANNYSWTWSATAGTLANNTGLNNSFTVPAGEALITIDGDNASCGNKQVVIRVIPSNVTLAAPTVTQPDCFVLTGSITVNTAIASAVEYSIDNGLTWQPFNVFNGLAIGPYNIVVRKLSSPFCSTAYPGNPVMIANNSLPSVIVPQNQAICDGTSSAAIGFTGSTVSGTNYNWTNDNPSIGLAAAGTGDIASFMAVNNTAAPIVANISVTAVAGSCSSAAQNFTITVNPTPSVNPVNDHSFCSNVAGNTIVFSGNVTGTVYNWTNNNPAIGLAANGTGNINSFTVLNNSSAATTAGITVVSVYSNAGQTCSGSPASFIINALPVPVVNAVNDISFCSGNSTTSITFGSIIPATQYNWSNDNTSIGLPASGTGSIPAFTAINNTAAAVTANISVMPVLPNGSSFCNGVAETFTVSINPLPLVNPISPVMICHGTATGAINFTGNVAGAVYSWQNNNTAIGLAAAGTGNIPSFTAQNNTNADIQGTITVAVVVNGCPGASVDFPVTVYASPKLGADKTIFICKDAKANLVELFNPIGITMNYFIGGSPVANPAAVSSGIYLVTGINANSCKDSVLVTVQTYADIDLQVFSNPPAANIIEGQTIQLSATGTGITGYSWSPSASLSAPSAATIIAMPGSSTNYFLTATNAGGCTDTASIRINVTPLDIIPSAAFTPNGDGYTEKWIVKNIQYAKTNQLVIFNRLGNKVFETSNYQNNWDGTYKGKPLPDGAYYYQLRIITANNRTIDKSGSITLIR